MIRVALLSVLLDCCVLLKCSCLLNVACGDVRWFVVLWLLVEMEYFDAMRRDSILIVAIVSLEFMLQSVMLLLVVVLIFAGSGVRVLRWRYLGFT